ncbi:autoinducer 2 ABC transporter substrate-binding protein [Niallia nealsonii]|uniref:Autoinducer 2 ABC transporter substrate-binding protein n=1 Tax=Niallia nealsonii TaxID=115979 RepID=A0A2N0Z807_9BACI|nr:autoinducer 2 ABC transporter substrate-binding protein [Niallia nealsonii]PKG25624.1 autoinducer 2 ABC transporter substrate-binding protein [Niallia nealsonii]
MKKRQALFIILLLFVSGCSSGDYKIVYIKEKLNSKENAIKETEKYTIGVVPKVENIPYFTAVEEGALEAGKDLGVEVMYIGPTVADSKQQIKIIDELIEKNVDVLAVSANDPEDLIPVLLKAKSQGVRVFTWDSDVQQEGREFFINMVDPEVLGRHIMDTLAWALNEKGSYAIITGSTSAANVKEWVDWIQIQQRDKYPNMELVKLAESDDNPRKAYLAAKEILKKYPNIKGIIGGSSVGPPSISKAIKEEEKQGKVAVVGLSPPNSMNEYLKDGTAQMITLWSPKKLGYLTVSIAVNLLRDISPYDRQDINGVGKITRKGDAIIMGDPIDFTKDNVDQYDF